MDELEERLLNYIDRERRFVWRDYLELQDMEVEARVERGLCVSGVRCTKEGVFNYSDNLSKFRSGEFVFVSEGHPIGEEIRSKGVRAIIREFHPERNQFIIEPDNWRPAGFSNLTGKKNLTIDTRNEDFLTKRLKKSVNAVFDNTNSTSEKIRSILNGSFKEAPEDKNNSNIQSCFEGIDFLPKQEEAFIDCFRRTFKLIQGPPGTGKTFLLAHIISALAMSGKKILVTAFTHRAINNVLNMVVKETDYKNVAKSGDGHDDDLDKRVGEVVDETEGCIIGATVFKAYKEYGLEDYFDVVVFDEAGQMPLSHAICGMLHGRSYIFVGDHMQLGPIVVGNHSDKEMQKSIFEYLYDRYPDISTMLDESFRMNEWINEFPSRHFYHGVLKPHESALGRKLQIKSGGDYQTIIDPDKPVVFVDTGHEGFMQSSKEEANLSAGVLVELIDRHGIKPSNIAVIASHRVQVRTITDETFKLAEKVMGKKRLDQVKGDLVIDTVERIQGQERDVIIISLAASDEDFILSEAAFLLMPNRFNVAITRPRKKLIIIGSKYFFRAKPLNEDKLCMINHFKKLYHHLKNKGWIIEWRN